MALALASGAAGALAFTTGAPATLVGVMVAVALLPPTVATGMFMGSGRLDLSAGAATLLAVNVVSVNLAATLTFLLQGVRPDRWWSKRRANAAILRAMIIWTALLAALTALLVFGPHPALS